MNNKRLYLQEINHNIEFAKQAYNMYQSALSKRNIPAIFTYIHYFLIHIANVDKLLDCRSNSFRKKILLDEVDFSSIDLKPFRRLRNHLEHFDERLDSWVKEYDGHTYFDMNLITGCKGFPKKAYLRALDGNIFKFYGEEFDLGILYDELIKIEKIIEE